MQRRDAPDAREDKDLTLLASYLKRPVRLSEPHAHPCASHANDVNKLTRIHTHMRMHAGAPPPGGDGARGRARLLQRGSHGVTGKRGGLKEWGMKNGGEAGNKDVRRRVGRKDLEPWFARCEGAT